MAKCGLGADALVAPVTVYKLRDEDDSLDIDGDKLDLFSRIQGLLRICYCIGGWNFAAICMPFP